MAPAKLTWYLEITGRRSDGYHLLRSEMVTLAFADCLALDESANYVRVATPAGHTPADRSNLVVRALELVDRSAGVTIDKRLPIGGGLGGGSADAAAILRWAGRVSVDEAMSLGSDVPFCQLGGRALVEGVGELLTPLPFVARDVTLFLPSFGVDTGTCYRAFDELRATGQALRGRNHLEDATRAAEPRLALTIDWLRATVGREIHLAGSGSTMFAEGHVQPGLGSWDVRGPVGTVRCLQTTTTPA